MRIYFWYTTAITTEALFDASSDGVPFIFKYLDNDVNFNPGEYKLLSNVITDYDPEPLGVFYMSLNVTSNSPYARVCNKRNSLSAA